MASQQYTFVAVNSKRKWNPVSFLDESERIAANGPYNSSVRTVYVLRHSHIAVLEGDNVIPITLGPADGMIEARRDLGRTQYARHSRDEGPKRVHMLIKGDHWSHLPMEIGGDGLRLCHIQNKTLEHIVKLATDFRDFINQAPKNMTFSKHLYQKLGWVLGQAKSVHETRSFLGVCVKRRTDFVRPENITNDFEVQHLFRTIFSPEFVEFLERGPDLPAFSSWHGRDMSAKLSLEQLICLFARNIRDECWTNILARNLVEIFPARLYKTWDKLEVGKHLEDKQSLMNGQLIWIVDKRTLHQSIPSLVDRGGMRDDSRAWTDMFSQGSLHVVTKGDCNRRQITVHPPLHKDRTHLTLEWMLGMVEYEDDDVPLNQKTYCDPTADVAACMI